jgi:hypothetical protein
LKTIVWAHIGVAVLFPCMRLFFVDNMQTISDNNFYWKHVCKHIGYHYEFLMLFSQTPYTRYHFDCASENESKRWKWVWASGEKLKHFLRLCHMVWNFIFRLPLIFSRLPIPHRTMRLNASVCVQKILSTAEKKVYECKEKIIKNGIMFL